MESVHTNDHSRFNIHNYSIHNLTTIHSMSSSRIDQQNTLSNNILKLLATMPKNQKSILKPPSSDSDLNFRGSASVLKV
jgi:hypothetical protein